MYLAVNCLAILFSYLSHFPYSTCPGLLACLNRIWVRQVDSSRATEGQREKFIRKEKELCQMLEATPEIQTRVFM